MSPPLGHFFSSRSKFSPALDIKTSPDISSLEQFLSRKNFDEVIGSSELFWLTYCKAASKIPGEPASTFSTSLQGKKLIISGKEHIISNVQKFIEEIRKIFVKNLAERKGFVLLPISFAMKVFIREKLDIVDLSDWLSDKHITVSDTCFQDFIRPGLTH